MDTPRIAVLPSELIDQIAAGEVVERPASVAKELAENALDAGARTITVDVEGGGRRAIRVVDDGCGMSAAEAELALARHATSKLRRFDDLSGITTMGFRGEALPSIASVSKMVLTTRRRDDEAATRLVIEAGRVVDIRQAGAPVGTSIEVRELLGNVPARLKFLKGDATESSHLSDAVTRLALAHPDVHFRLRYDGRTAIDAPPAGSALDRVAALWGGRLAGASLGTATCEESGIRVAVYLAAPEAAQTTARGVQLFVGRRYVRDRGLLHAVTMGYGELLPRGRYPVAVVMVDCPTGTVDVNVHPQKLEVRFSDASTVAAAVRQAVRRAVASAGWTMAPVHIYAVTSAAPLRATEPAPTYLRAEPGNQLGLAGWGDRMRAVVAERRAANAGRVVRRPADEVGDDPLIDRRFPTPAPHPAPSAGALFRTLRYIGQLDRTYLICEGDGELVLVDQHAAHERVLFDDLAARGTADASRQRLLFPARLALDATHRAVASASTDALAAAGFEVEVDGEVLQVLAVPAQLRGVEPLVLLQRILGDLASARIAEAERRGHILSAIACSSAVRAGDALEPGEAEALLTRLAAVEAAGLSPHGKPLVLRMAIAELARRFGR